MDEKRKETGLSRRGLLAGGTAVCFATRSLMAETALAAAPASVPGPRPSPLKSAGAGYTIENKAKGLRRVNEVHAGKVWIDLCSFRFDGASLPARFITYDLPPGGSEGVHVHYQDDHNDEGAYDEYYYIVSGSGQMEIDGVIVPVEEGDHIHTPLTVAHGIENTHPTLPLKVFLTFIDRATG